MKIEYFIKPSWKNLILTILIWHAGIAFYILLAGYSENSLFSRYTFYVTYSWTGLLLCYFTVIWSIPKFFLKKKYIALLISNIFLLILYVIIRYYYNTFLYQYEYYEYKNGIYVPGNIYDIISRGLSRGLSFIVIAYVYRFFIDWIIIDRIKNKLENEKLKSDLKSLRYQLNPHFLFNIINNIYYLSLIKSDKTAKSLIQLSDLLRYVLDEKEDLTEIQNEVDYLKKFIELHKLRFSDAIVHFNVQEDIQNCKLKIPPMLLLTFIENAFKHGSKETISDPIKIELILSDDKLTYTVENTIGESISKDKTSGIGLKNLNQRLQLLYPNKHKVILTNNNNHFFAKLIIQYN